MPRRKPVVGVVCGSVSDFPIVEETMKTLEELGIPYSLDVKSAHRLPEGVRKYALEADKKGYKVIVAAAGGAAALSGTIAAYTALPVIGLPIKTSALSGVDSLYSMVQMPEGVPVGVMGIDRARNAAIFAAEIIGASDLEVRARLHRYRREHSENTSKEAEKVIREMKLKRRPPKSK